MRGRRERCNPGAGDRNSRLTIETTYPAHLTRPDISLPREVLNSIAVVNTAPCCAVLCGAAVWPHGRADVQTYRRAESLCGRAAQPPPPYRRSAAVRRAVRCRRVAARPCRRADVQTCGVAVWPCRCAVPLCSLALCCAAVPPCRARRRAVPPFGGVPCRRAELQTCSAAVRPCGRAAVLLCGRALQQRVSRSQNLN